MNGIVVHYGSGMHYGHYWSLARTPGPNHKWIEYDDTKIKVVEDKEVQYYYGAPSEVSSNPSWNTAYMLLYESEDLQPSENEEGEKQSE